jgi:chaperonin GroEL (HSP60 family)
VQWPGNIFFDMVFSIAHLSYVLHKCWCSAGADLVRKALRIPCFTIASNAGVDAQEVVQRVISEKFEVGYDALNGVYVDMMKSGIIDPTKVSASYATRS